MNEMNEMNDRALFGFGAPQEAFQGGVVPLLVQGFGF
jgi:hypothetical protein